MKTAVVYDMFSSRIHYIRFYFENLPLEDLYMCVNDLINYNIFRLEVSFKYMFVSRDLDRNANY